MYALSQAWRSLQQHPTSTLATFFTALVSFSLLFLVGLVLWNLDRVVATLESELEVAAFLKPEANTQVILGEIQGWADVPEVRLESKEEAFGQLLLDYPYLSQSPEFVDNPLPDTLRLKLANPEQVREIAQRVGRLEGVESVEYGGALTEQLVRVLAGLRVAAYILIGLLLVNTLFSVMGTIRLSIENRRDELRVMQLVGATRAFIQGPFVAEGILLTLFSGLVALGLGFLSYRFISGALQSLLPFFPVLGTQDLIRGMVGLVLLAFVIGAFGAYFASRANLKEQDL